VSFHAGERGAGPDYPGDWDGVPGKSAARIIDWSALLLADRYEIVESEPTGD
jgi:hypothetical protein